MNSARKTVLSLSIFAALFVLGTAIFTGNSGLYLLAGLSAATALTTWQSTKRK